MHRNESRVELKPGDPVSDFSLPGSDGRTCRLKELATCADGRILEIDRKVSPASHGRDVAARLKELRVQR